MTTTPRELGAQVESPEKSGDLLPDVSVITITPEQQGHVPFRELWDHRELLFFLVWRDVKVRYRQTVIGAGWAVIQPLVTMVIFTAVFNRIAKIGSEGIPYPVFAYSGLLIWQLFAGALQRSIQSVVSSAPLITKVYFPRLVVPLAATVSATVDFAIAFIVLVILIISARLVPTWRIVALPGFVGLALLAALAVGLWLSALNVRYRDIGHAVPFLLQMWMFASPVAYPVSLVPGALQPFYRLNPMVGAIEGFRWALFGQPIPDPQTILVSAGVVLVVLAGGLVYFRRVERYFADVI